MMRYSVLYLLCKMMRKEYIPSLKNKRGGDKNKGRYAKDRKNPEG